MRSILDLPIASSPEAAQAAGARAIAEELVAADDAVFLNDLLDLPQPVELRGLYDAMDNAARNRGKQDTVARLVARASRAQPLLLVVEDVHWAEGPTLDHLARLTHAVADCPALLVITSRVEGDPLDRGWRGRTGGAPLTTIDLGPLRPEEARALVEAFVTADAGLAERCIERAAGNPLFLEQLLRHAEEDLGTGVPGSIRSLVQARLDQLEAADKAALQAASVLGQRFGREVLAHVLGEPDYPPERLATHFLVRPEGDTFLFAHALIRDAIYDSLLRSRRRALHQRAAAWFADRDPVLHAEHLERAADAAAAQAYAAAAMAEAAALHYERSLHLAERGLALAGADEDQLRLGMLRADVLRELGRPGESIGAFREALERARDERWRCRAWIGIAAGVHLIGGQEEGLQALDKAEPIARRQGTSLELAQICYYRGCLLFAAGEVEACLEQHLEARQAAIRAGDPEWEAHALSGLGDAHYGRGRMRLAMEHFRECSAVCRKHGFGRIEVGNIHMIGVTRRYLNEFREAIDDMRAAVDMAARVGNRRTEMVARAILGELLADSADLKATYAALDESLAIADALGNRRFRIYALYELGRAFWYDDRRRAEAEPMLAEALELSREIGMAFLGPRVLAAKALVTDSDPERCAALDEGEAIVRSGCLAHVALWFYRDAIEASLNATDWHGTERYATALDEYTRREPLAWSNFFIARGRALAAHGSGYRDPELAAELKRLKNEAEQLGYRTALPAIAAALRGE